MKRWTILSSAFVAMHATLSRWIDDDDEKQLDVIVNAVAGRCRA